MDGIPPETSTLFQEATRHLEARELDRAATCFRAVLERVPDWVAAQVNLAWALEGLGHLAEAERGYLRALELDPVCLEAHRNLGVLLVGQKRFEAAEDLYARFLGLHPDSPAAWSNLGALKVSLGLEAQAEACFRRALELDPNYARARYNLGYLFLRDGKFEEGWLCHQARERFAYTAQFTFPCWRGEDLAGKSLLIAAEAGHGDMIQFCRYAALLKARGAARIGVLCHPPLKRLFATLDGADGVLGLEDPLPRGGWDFWSLPLTLPLHCATRLATIPATLPYLHPRADWIAAWRPRVPREGTRVGLVWKGNPKFETDADRSLAHLTDLAPLWAAQGARFVSLQKGPGQDEALHPPAAQPLVELGSSLTDFADTAAIMASLDLVITVDTATAHLAGALGRPCWVLLPAYRQDWRWLKERTDSPWYPDVMRLYRQPEGGWEPLIKEVAADLAVFTHNAARERAKP